MKSMASWLIAIFVVMFWIFRLVVCYVYSTGTDLGFPPTDMMTEIIVLFVSFTGILFMFNRKRIGAILYSGSYFCYFGYVALNGVINLANGKLPVEDQYNSFLISFIAIVLAILALADLFLNKDRAESKDNKDTYWFYKNKKYERNLDERADKNQYRIR